MDENSVTTETPVANEPAANTEQTDAEKVAATPEPDQSQEDENQMQKLSFEQAQTTLFEEVYAPVFFAKLAQDYGIAPQSIEERDALIQAAANLNLAKAHEETQKKASHSSLVLEATEGLNNIMQERGLTSYKQADNNQAILEVANAAVQNEKIAAAAEAFLQAFPAA